MQTLQVSYLWPYWDHYTHILLSKKKKFLFHCYPASVLLIHRFCRARLCAHLPAELVSWNFTKPLFLPASILFVLQEAPHYWFCSSSSVRFQSSPFFLCTFILLHRLCHIDAQLVSPRSVQAQLQAPHASYFSVILMLLIFSHLCPHIATRQFLLFLCNSFFSVSTSEKISVPGNLLYIQVPSELDENVNHSRQ